MTKITENSKSVKWMEDNSHSALFLRAQWALPWVAEDTQGFLKVIALQGGPFLPAGRMLPAPGFRPCLFLCVVTEWGPLIYVALPKPRPRFLGNPNELDKPWFVTLAVFVLFQVWEAWAEESRWEQSSWAALSRAKENERITSGKHSPGAGQWAQTEPWAHVSWIALQSWGLI